MRLFADPAGLDGAGKLLERCIGRQVGQIVFAFAGRAVLADEPYLLAGQMLGAHVADPPGWAVGNPDANRGEARRERSFRAATPTDRSPGGLSPTLPAR